MYKKLSRAPLLDSVRYRGHLKQVGTAKIMRSISDSRLAGWVMRPETDLFGKLQFNRKQLWLEQ